MLDQLLTRQVEALERIASALEAGAGKVITTNAEDSTAAPPEATPKKRGRKKKTAEKAANKAPAEETAEETAPPAEETAPPAEETAEESGADAPKLGLEDVRTAITGLLTPLSDDKVKHDAMRTAIGAKMVEVTGITRLGDMNGDQLHKLALALQEMA